MVNGSYQDTIDVFQKIKSYGFPCYVLSNWSDETYEGMEDEYPFLKEFDDKIISGREFLVKPDPQIYKLAMSRFDLVPEETLFIDDREDNIQAAENLGFQTIHLTDPSTIKSDIKKFLVV
jgi:2-haloacid dehalogenase